MAHPTFAFGLSRHILPFLAVAPTRLDSRLPTLEGQRLAKRPRECPICGRLAPANARYHDFCKRADDAFSTSGGDLEECKALMCAVLRCVVEDLKEHQTERQAGAVEALEAPGWLETLCELAGVGSTVAESIRALAAKTVFPFPKDVDARRVPRQEPALHPGEHHRTGGFVRFEFNSVVFPDPWNDTDDGT